MEEIRGVFEEYGADMRVLEEYDCIPLRARIVRDMVKVRTSVGTRAFKRVLLSEDRLAYIQRCLEYVASRGFSHVPRMIRNRYGDPYVIHTSGFYYMTAWIPGRDADFRKLPELLAGARLLAAWHGTAAGFRPAGLRPPTMRTIQDRIASAIHDFTTARQAALGSDNPSPFQRLLLACANEVQERCEQAFALFGQSRILEAEQTARSEGLLCHGNYHKHNVLFDGESMAILNYEGVHPGLPVTDLAFLCHRYLPSFEWDPDVLVQAVEAYQSVGGNRSAEISHLDALLAIPLRTLQVISWFHRGAKDWDEEDFVDYLEECLGLEEQRDEARSWLQSKKRVTQTPPTGLARSEQKGGTEWNVATFTVNPPTERDSPDESEGADESGVEVKILSSDAPVTMEVTDVKEGVLVVRSPKEALQTGARRRRHRRRENRVFQPEQPGLRLWSPNEHRGKDDKE